MPITASVFPNAGVVGKNFGKDGVIIDKDPIEQEKRLKYLDLVASAVILQNTVDMTGVIHSLNESGF
ncbi:MAG: Tn3 family transposase, partial [Cyanobacteria bacterium P01_E01_bin.35]